MSEMNGSEGEQSPRKRQRSFGPAPTQAERRIDPSKHLPPETFSYILSFLPPPSLVEAAQVSRSWSSFCLDESLWRELALRLDYCQLERAAEESHTGYRVVASVLQHFQPAQQDSPQDLLQTTLERYRTRSVSSYFDDCDSWRTLCYRLWRLNTNWTPGELKDLLKADLGRTTYDTSTSDASTSKANTPSSSLPETEAVDTAKEALQFLFPYRRVINIRPNGSGARRIKLDPEEKTVIVTCQNGGIQVLDHDTKSLLWHIPRTATSPFPHLKFSHGWMIFDRQGLGHFEVWRSERLVADLGRAPDRGHFQRFTILDSVRPIRAYRFQYPYLCAATQDGFILIWHVPQQKVVETINMRDSPHRDGNITYIEFDDEFVFLNGVGAKSVSVFSRATQQMVWNMGQHFASGALPPTTWRFDRNESETWTSFLNPCFIERKLVRAPPNLWQAGPNTMNLAQLTMTPYQIWSAVHPDLKTKTLLILGQGTVLLIRDYKKFFNNPSQAPSLFVEIEFQNLQEYYDNTVLRGDEDWAGLGWNSRRLWESRPDAQLTVHEGRAVIINGEVFILDLNAGLAQEHVDEFGSVSFSAERASDTEDGRYAAPEQQERLLSSFPSTPTEQTQGVSSPASTDTGSTQEAPPVRVYQNGNEAEADLYDGCSSVQMDEVGIYVTVDKHTNDLDLLGSDLDENDLTGDDRVLLHFDFSRRHEIVPTDERIDCV